ncbi:diguanylate phosphodiesterase [Methanocella sp. CWC-04]|uniref:Diguanylate phosphodiesterase n=1 Tax=Methanooceanicella nereidis TaxID=2052831 RepID=A0AAP2RD79_9EURY|nr:ABC transporter substrate-binding protein [Methanocella sp. CWC-04]MCD1295426.1 diguanylate phosphodiesterase [Methanocella sp. CWC-04]
MGLIAACLCLTMIFSGCVTRSQPDPSGTPTQNPGTGSQFVSPGIVDTIHLAGGDYGYPTPFQHYPRGPGSFKMNLIFDALVEKDDKGIVPWLAEKWDIGADGKEYTFYLRKNVKWQDREDFTADDVKFSIEYVTAHPPVSGADLSAIESVTVIDDHTIKMTLSQPIAPFIYQLYSFKIIPEHIWSDVSDPNTYSAPEAVIGTGPYKLAEYSKEHGTYKFVANENFWGPTPRVKNIEFVPVSDSLVSFQQNEIDFTGLSPDTIDMFKSDPGVYVFQQPAIWGYELSFNENKNSILKDKAVRQAFAYAIDRDELVEKVGRGAGKPGSMGILPQDHIWYNENIPQYEHDANKAKQVLADAGWKDSDGDGIMDKNGKKLSFTLILASGEARIGELVKERLKEAGIDVTIQAVESKSRDTKLKQGDFEIAINGYGGWGGDADYLRTKFCGTNFGMQGASHGRPLIGYQNDEVDKLALEQLKETDTEKRKQIIYKLQEVLAEDVPSVPLYYTASYEAYRPTVYDGWMNMFDHHEVTHSKLSYLDRTEIAWV